MRILKFYADWCGPCHMMKPLVDKIAKDTGIEVIEIDTEVEKDMVALYNVQSIPTLVFLDDEKEVSRTIGFVGETEIRKHLQ